MALMKKLVIGEATVCKLWHRTSEFFVFASKAYWNLLNAWTCNSQ